MLSKRRSDFLFILISGAYLVITFYTCIVHNIIININNYLAVGSWLIVLITRLLNNRRGRYALGLMLIMGTLQFLNFGVGSTSVRFGSSSVAIGFGFDFWSFLIAIAFYLVHRTTINRLIHSLFYGNPDEQLLKRNKKVEFYKKRFSDFNDDKFNTVYNSVSEYPEEAQEAIREIWSSKNA